MSEVVDQPARTVITEVRVFDGTRLTDPTTVTIDGGRVSADGATAGARTVHARGATLLPGLVDAHIHLHGRETLEALSSWGITTALDMATWSPALLASLRGLPGLTDIRSPGLPAIGPSGPHSRMGMPDGAIVEHPAQAEPFVAARHAEGVDYLKIVTEAPGAGGPAQGALDALVTAAHARGLAVVAHAASTGAYTMSLDAGADVVTHAPVDRPLDAATVRRVADDHRVVVPTLTMMEGTAAGRPGASYDAARDSVTALHEAGVPILAGTDANAVPGAPFANPHGPSLHHELELLVDAGLSPVDALRAATTGPAHHFTLADRGLIAPGLRADLVLVDGDPVHDIRDTRALREVWCAGTPVPVARR